MAQKQQTTYLDEIPVEMKVKVMKTAPDLQSLRSIAQTSPAYHEAYLRAEEDILRTVATNGLIVAGIDLIDTLTALKAAKINQQGADRNSRTAQLLTHFEQAGQTGQWGRLFLEITTSHDLIHLQSAVKQLTKSFCETTISKHPRSGQPHQPLALLHSENRRIQRAFYRWEIYAKLFGYLQVSFEHFRGAVDLPPVEVQAELFLKHLPWHEVEELSCLLDFATSQWAGILEKFAGKAKEDNRTLPDGFETGTPVELDDLTGSKGEDNVLALVCLGPQFLHKALSTSPEDLEQLIIPYIHVTYPPSGFSDCLTEHKTLSEQWGIPAHEFEGEDRKPSAGWLLTAWWDQRGYPHRPEFKKWGYVMWEQECFDDWGSSRKDVLNMCGITWQETGEQN